MISGNVKSHLIRGAGGLILGVALARVGLSNYGELHKMFVLRSPPLFLMFGGAVGIAAAGFFVFSRHQKLPERKIHPGTIPGGVLFGLGAVLAGGCPSIALVQLGEGYVYAPFSVAGIALGVWLYPKVHARFFRWSRGACDEDR